MTMAQMANASTSEILTFGINSTAVQITAATTLPVNVTQELLNNTTNNTDCAPLGLLLDMAPFGGDPEKLRLNAALTALSILIMIEVMLGLGCSVDIELIRSHLKRPVGIFVAAVTQFGFMPLIAFGMASAMNLEPVPGLATLVTASVPGGILSNILACLIKGDMTLSMLMSTTSTILALGFIPLNLFIYGSHYLPENTQIGSIVPYSSIAVSFSLMIAPALCGLIIKWRWPDASSKVILVCKISLVLTLIGLTVLSSLLYGFQLLMKMPKELWLIAFIMPSTGFFLGFAFATIGGMKRAARRTVAIETGCQNANMGAAILKVAFPTNMIGSYFLYPLLYGAIQFMEGIIFVVVALVYLKYYADAEDNSSLEKNRGRDHVDEHEIETKEIPVKGAMNAFLRSLHLRWLARSDKSDKTIILSSSSQSVDHGEVVVSDIAHDIAREASTKKNLDS